MLTFNMSYFLGLFPRLSTALPFTMEVIAASILLCLCTGTLVAVIRIAKVPFLHQLCEVWVYFVLPVIVRAFHISPDGWPLTTYVLIALGFHYTPVISEIIRPAYLSVDRGQHEAAMVFGLSPFHRVVHIIAPQALPVALPSLVSEAINILKDTSVMYFIGVVDLMGRAGLIINANYGQGKLETYCAVALIYWALVILVETAFHLFQKYNGNHERRAS